MPRSSAAPSREHLPIPPDDARDGARIWDPDEIGAIQDEADLALEAARITELAPEDFELLDDFPAPETHSIASRKHEGRNEDATLGSPERIAAEIEKLPELNTVAPELDAARMRTALEKERRYAAAVKARRVFGVLDGISGATKDRVSEGTGAVASRIASAEMSERLARLPDNATPEEAEKAFASAFTQADAAIKAYREEGAPNTMTTQDLMDRKIELSQLGSAAVLAAETMTLDGRRMVTVGSVGDCRVYAYDPASKKLTCLTVDDNVGGAMLKAGRVERADYDSLMRARSDEEVSPAMRTVLEEFRLTPTRAKHSLTNALGSEQFSIKTGPGGNVFSVELPAGTEIWMTSDGAHDNVTDGELERLIASGIPAEQIAEQASMGRKADDVTIVRFPVRNGADASDLEIARHEESRNRFAREAERYADLLRRLDSGDPSVASQAKQYGRDTLIERKLISEKQSLESEIRILDTRGDTDGDRRAKAERAYHDVTAQLEDHMRRHERALADARRGLDELYGKQAPAPKRRGPAPDLSSPLDAKNVPRKKGWLKSMFE